MIFYLADILNLISFCVFVICVPTKTRRNPQIHIRHHPKKNVTDCSSAYLRICLQAKKITALGMVKSNLDGLAPCVLKSSVSFFLESILGKRNSIENQVVKPSEYDGFGTPRKHTRVS